MDEMIISNKEFNGLLDLNLEYLREYFKDNKQKGYYPTLLLFGRSSQYQKLEMTVVVLADEEFDEKKYQIMSLAGIKFGGEQPASEYTVAAYLCSEGWMRNLKKGEKTPDNGRISNYSDKVEAIIYMGMTVDGRSNFGTFTIRRDKKDRIFNLKTHLRHDYQEANTENEGVRSDLLQAFWRGYSAGKLKKRFGGGDDKTTSV